MFIGWLQEWFDSLREKYSNQETVEITNDAIRDIQKHPNDCIDTLEKARDEFACEMQICNECGYNEFDTIKVVEDQDADDNQGRVNTYKFCKQCGKENT